MIKVQRKNDAEGKPAEHLYFETIAPPPKPAGDKPEPAAAGKA